MAWRDTMLEPKFFSIDAKSTFGLMIWMFHISWWTFYIALAVMGFYWLLSYLGINPGAAWGWIRSTLGGDYRPAEPFHKKRYLTDFK